MLLGLLLLAAPARAEGPPLERATLGGGLRLVSSVERAAPVVAVATSYRTGLLDEPAPGALARLVQALVDAPARGRPERQRELVEALGGRRYARIGLETTTIVDVVPAERLELALWLAGERLRAVELPAVGPPSLLERAPLVIQARDRLLGLALLGREHERPGGAAALWPGAFAAARSTLVVVGDFEPASLAASAEHFLGGIVAPPEPLAARPPLPEQRTRRMSSWRDATAQRALVAHGWLVPVRARAAARVCAALVAGGAGSRLELELVRTRGVAFGTAAGVATVRGGALVWLAAEVPRSVAPADAGAAIDRHLRDLSLQAPSERELVAARERLSTAERVALENRVTLAARLGEAELLDGDARALGRELEALAQVSAEDVRALAAELVPHRASVVEMLAAPWQSRAVADDDEPKDKPKDKPKPKKTPEKEDPPKRRRR